MDGPVDDDDKAVPRVVRSAPKVEATMNRTA